MNFIKWQTRLIALTTMLFATTADQNSQCGLSHKPDPGWIDWSSKYNGFRKLLRAKRDLWIGRSYRGTQSTSRGLNMMMQNFKHINGSDMEEALASKAGLNNVSILEIGCGEGRALLELSARYPTWQGNCLNYPGYKQTAGKGKSASGANKSGSATELRRVVKHYNIRLDPKISLPNVFYGDAGYPWRFPTSSFDFIMSQGAASKVYNIENLVRETMRVLSPGGQAFLSMGQAITCIPRLGPDVREINLLGSCFVVRSDDLVYPRVLVKYKLNYRAWNTVQQRLTATLMLEKEILNQKWRLSCPERVPDSIFLSNAKRIANECVHWTPCALRMWQKVNHLLLSLRQNP